MKQYFYFLFFITLSMNTYAQLEKTDSTILDGDNLSRKELYSLQNNGWINMKYRGKKLLINLSNKNYVLHFSINCKDQSQKPSFLIEYSNNYREGNYGGIDFISSESDTSGKIMFFIDEQEFQNPFEKAEEPIFESFKAALMEGKKLTIKYFTYEFNPETGKDQLKLNRALDFRLENSHLLAEAVDCKEQKQTTTLSNSEAVQSSEE